uniref:ATP synthase complex subunit 8 n=1 Tax=Scolytinae sp. BMNH 1043123 TaxID=1903797 RepID=A0A343A5A9_9CUCU|nr:ATP synthase F0 subunit 8 [Scolytinae sp. BMNH 1043123]
MPQMGPLQWTSMYMYFSLLFITTILINYYMFSYNSYSKNIKQIKIETNWKW